MSERLKHSGKGLTFAANYSEVGRWEHVMRMRGLRHPLCGELAPR